nr:MAG TPA: hypothetical protein [Caudoviricetes sp.]
MIGVIAYYPILSTLLSRALFLCKNSFRKENM